MNDNDIIKALECCIHNDLNACFECPYYTGNRCQIILMKDALALIKRQKEEIELLSVKARKYDQEHHDNINIGLELSEMLKFHYEQQFQEAKAAIKPEAYREFAERLKNVYIGGQYYTRPGARTRISTLFLAIETILKELEGKQDE